MLTQNPYQTLEVRDFHNGETNLSLPIHIHFDR